MSDTRRMKRAIYFRGKRLDTGEWVTGQLICDTYSRGPFGYSQRDDHAYIIHDEHPSTRDPAEIYMEVDPATVGQYTGQNDYYERLIFEGDILEFDLGEDFDGAPLGPCRCEVLWERGGWRIKEKGYASEPMDRVPDDAEIIGNVHDDPWNA